MPYKDYEKQKEWSKKLDPERPYLKIIKQELLEMIEELDILRAVAGGEHSLDDCVRDIAKPLYGQVKPDTRLSDIQSVFEENNVAIVVSNGEAVGVVNKIDVLEFIAYQRQKVA